MEKYLNRIICADSLDIMRELPDKSVDLVLTDPPYGIGIDGQKLSINKNPKHNRKQHEFMGWDTGIPPVEYFTELRRVSKNQIIWGGNYFLEYLTESHKGWLVWDKGQKGLTMSDGELAYTSFDTPLRIIEINRCQLLKDYTEHPTQKPLKLFEQCLTWYSHENQTILDPFAGSCTTAEACKKLGRNFICIEKEERYCKIGEIRLAQEVLDL